MIKFWYNFNVMIFRELWVDKQIYTEYMRDNVVSKLFDNLDLKWNRPNIIHFNLFNSQQNYLERFDCYSRRGSFYNILSDRWLLYNLQSPDFFSFNFIFEVMWNYFTFNVSKIHFIRTEFSGRSNDCSLYSP